MTVCRCGRDSLGLRFCYWCAKSRVDWSTTPPSPDGLSEVERVFVGIFRPRRRDGWRSAGDWIAKLDPDPEIDVERTAMLHWLTGGGEEPTV